MSDPYANNDDNFEEDSCETLVNIGLIKKREVFSVGSKIKYTLLMIPGDR